MQHAENFRSFFAAMTLIVLGAVSMLKIGTVDMHAIIATSIVVIPAVVVMAFLGQKMGELVDNPKNKADADYKLAVLNALKKMDKSITLQELNKKLTKQVAEPDIPDNEEELDI